MVNRIMLLQLKDLRSAREWVNKSGKLAHTVAMSKWFK